MQVGVQHLYNRGSMKIRFKLNTGYLDKLFEECCRLNVQECYIEMDIDTHEIIYKDEYKMYADDIENAVLGEIQAQCKTEDESIMNN